MNIEKLKLGEKLFLEKYPGGFENPYMVEIGKKHRIEKLTARAREVFAKDRFDNPEIMSEDIIKTITSSSMVSVFEKPVFRDFVRGLTASDRTRLCSHMFQLLHGNMKKGFESLVDFLVPAKLAKWTLITTCPYYYKPDKEVFIKPTTVKNVIAYFEIENLEYKARPSWDFYEKYRDVISKMKAQVHPLLKPENGAFSGFLMMVMGGLK